MTTRGGNGFFSGTWKWAASGAVLAFFLTLPVWFSHEYYLHALVNIFLQKHISLTKSECSWQGVLLVESLFS